MDARMHLLFQHFSCHYKKVVLSSFESCPRKASKVPEAGMFCQSEGLILYLTWFPDALIY